MKKFLFWFNLGMILVYVAAGVAFYFSTIFPQFYGNIRLFASLLIIGYGLYRLFVTIKKYNYEKQNAANEE